MHPQPRVRFVVGVCTRVFTAEAPETSGIPHAMVLRLISRSPRGPGFHAPVIPEKLASQELGASVGASGPHDFTVSDLGVRLTQGRVHRIPLPTFVTIAKRPSSRPGTRGKVPVICPTAQARSPATCWHDGQFAHGRLAGRDGCAIGQLRRSPGAPSTLQPLRDGICSASRARSWGRRDGKRIPSVRGALAEVSFSFEPPPISDRARPERCRPRHQNVCC